ncbi:MAG: TlpA family protein disulfide reductase [bacterium]|nr:TlpA family protein disulfide reductase [bacterium]
MSKAGSRCILYLLVCVVAACGDSGVPARLDVGSPVPEFNLPALEGGEVASGSLVGEVVVLNFWATWCQPCLKEIPELKELATDDRLRVVGIALDDEGVRVVRPFVESHGMDYTILLGDQEIFQRMGGITIPYTLVLDRSQNVVNVYRGPATRSDIEQDLERIDTAA